MEETEFWKRAQRAQEAVADLVARFFGEKPPLEKMYDAWLGEGWEKELTPPFKTYTIYNVNNEPIPCPICGETDKWVKDGHEQKGDLGKVFVCDHGPVEYFPMIRNRATQPITTYEGGPLVWKWEEHVL